MMTGRRHAGTTGPGGRRLAALTGVLGITLMSMVIPADTGSAAGADACTPAAGMAACATRHATDDYIDSDGVTPKSDPYNMRVDASQTANLQPRQNVILNLSGFAPTRNYTFVPGNNHPENDEYPVVILQCWGADDGNLDPTHCFDDVNKSIDDSTYLATNNPDHPTPGDKVPPTDDGAHYPGFNAVNGKHYDLSGIDQAPSDLITSAGAPTNRRIEWVPASGNRSNIPFEVRASDQFPSLGCSSTQRCSIVVVPILHPDFCTPDGQDGSDFFTCTAASNESTTPAFSQDAFFNQYLNSRMWWLPTNWKNRMSIPFSFAPQPTQCPTSDSRQPVRVSGSELAYGAMFSWAPFFCNDPKRFDLAYVPLTEPRARDAYTQGGPGRENAVLTSLPVTNSSRPTVHAPVAVTGFTVAYLLDDKNNQQVFNLNLTPLLLAKLITGSYRGAQTTEPALGHNPISLLDDPEFQSINKNIGVTAKTVSADWTSTLNMIMFGGGVQSDEIWALTSYINADPEARAWLDGKPDDYSGMVVNPNYRGYSLPQLATELRDNYQEPRDGTGANPTCQTNNPIPNQTLLSQPVNSLQDAALDEESGLGQATWVCEPLTNLWKKNGNPQSSGSRALLALTSVPFAEVYGLPMANLQVHQQANGNRFFAAPLTGPTGQDPTPMTAALAFSTQDKASGALSLDYAHLAPNAYPGTMPVYGAVPTAGLDKATAGDYANWLTYAATDGQVRGSALGQLPLGYAPLTGALAPLAAFTAQAAKDVAAQDGQVPTPPGDLGQQIGNRLGVKPFTGPVKGGHNGSGGAGAGAPAGGAAPAAPPPVSPAGATSAPAAKATPRTVALTRGTGSWLAAWGLPVLLGVGLLAGLGVPLVRVAGQPGHPVRVGLARFGTRIAAMVSRRTP